MIESLYFFAIFIGFAFPNHIFIRFFQVVVIIFLFALNVENADYQNYLNTYDSIKNRDIYYDYFLSYEYGYQAIANFFSSIDMSFFVFRFFCITTALILINKAFKILSPKYVNCLFSLYLIFPFLLDVIQIRNFIGLSICIYAFALYFDSKFTEKNKYIFGTILGSFFQVTLLSYLLLLFLNSKTRLLIPFFAIFFFTNIYFFNYIISNFPVSLYFQTETSLTTQIALPALMIFIISFISFCGVNHIRFKIYKTKLINSLIFVLLFISPILSMNVEFFRLFRNFIPLCFPLVFLIRMNYVNITFKYLIILLVIFILFYYKYIFSNFSGVYVALFEENNHILFSILNN